MRLIDADALHEDFMNDLFCLKFGSALQGTPRSDIDISNVLERIEDFPAIEAELVKHGKWKDRYNNGDWHCSVCGAIVEEDEQSRHNWYRCYHCGAKMDGKDDKQE